jgi:hypothetical protein
MGSGGSSGQQNSVSKFEAPDYTLQGKSGSTPGFSWQDYLARNNAIINNMSANPYQYIYGLTKSGSIDPSKLVAGQDNLTKTAQSGQDYLAQQALLNPSINYLMSTMSGANANPYMGDNPQLDQMVASSNKDITDNYKATTQAQQAGAAARSGAFGGSADQQQQALNNKGLAEALAGNEANLRGQNYYNSGNLYEQGANRAMNAAGQMVGVNQAEAQNLAALNQSGQQNQGYQQSILDATKGVFNQNSQYYSLLNDLMGSALSRASGSGGSTTTQVMGPGFSTAQGLLGLGATGLGAYLGMGG